jgi:hypothetical protein
MRHSSTEVSMVYRRGPLRRISFKNLLFAVCMDAIATGLFCLQQPSNRALLVVTPDAWEAARLVLTQSPLDVK